MTDVFLLTNISKKKLFSIFSVILLGVSIVNFRFKIHYKHNLCEGEWLKFTSYHTIVLLCIFFFFMITKFLGRIKTNMLVDISFHGFVEVFKQTYSLIDLVS